MSPFVKNNILLNLFVKKMNMNNQQNFRYNQIDSKLLIIFLSRQINNIKMKNIIEEYLQQFLHESESDIVFQDRFTSWYD